LEAADDIYREILILLFFEDWSYLIILYLTNGRDNYLS